LIKYTVFKYLHIPLKGYLVIVVNH